MTSLHVHGCSSARLYHWVCMTARHERTALARCCYARGLVLHYFVHCVLFGYKLPAAMHAKCIHVCCNAMFGASLPPKVFTNIAVDLAAVLEAAWYDRPPAALPIPRQGLLRPGTRLCCNFMLATVCTSLSAPAGVACSWHDEYAALTDAWVRGHIPTRRPVILRMVQHSCLRTPW
jgi:hypothetical protein